mmetsp:Transcript_23785/g.60092  ORF Transcript_23785/g.60092 Transcript_23785/m.60092 type:complete len:395 (-) Transcript_23785:2230-3414(-)
MILDLNMSNAASSVTSTSSPRMIICIPCLLKMSLLLLLYTLIAAAAAAPLLPAGSCRALSFAPPIQQPIIIRARKKTNTATNRSARSRAVGSGRGSHCFWRWKVIARASRFNGCVTGREISTSASPLESGTARGLYEQTNSVVSTVSFPMVSTSPPRSIFTLRSEGCSDLALTGPLNFTGFSACKTKVASVASSGNFSFGPSLCNFWSSSPSLSSSSATEVVLLDVSSSPAEEVLETCFISDVCSSSGPSIVASREITDIPREPPHCFMKRKPLPRYCSRTAAQRGWSKHSYRPLRSQKYSTRRKDVDATSCRGFRLAFPFPTSAAAWKSNVVRTSSFWSPDVSASFAAASSAVQSTWNSSAASPFAMRKTDSASSQSTARASPILRSPSSIRE